MKYVTPNREMPIKLTSDNYYREVIEIVEEWSYKNYFSIAIVCLSKDGEKTNQLLLLDNGADYVFLNDWWEGEKDVSLIGFTMIEDIDIKGWTGK